MNGARYRWRKLGLRQGQNEKLSLDYNHAPGCRTLCPYLALGHSRSSTHNVKTRSRDLYIQFVSTFHHPVSIPLLSRMHAYADSCSVESPIRYPIHIHPSLTQVSKPQLLNAFTIPPPINALRFPSSSSHTNDASHHKATNE